VRAFVSLNAGDLFAFGKGAPPPDPDDPLSRLSVEALDGALKGAGGSLRFVKPDSRHLTLRFLGEVDEGVSRSISQALGHAVASFKPFPVGAFGVGFFPNAVRPKIIWVGLDDPKKQLTPLYEAVEKALGPLGLADAADSFVPHVTVARVSEAPTPHALAQAVDPLARARFGWSEATGVEFIESQLKKGGPVYRTISKHPFGGA
jgi:RNA 2',3'-cyclic 3'-phosphodiesterase